METITFVLALLLSVVVSSFICRVLPLQVPRPLLQIGIGAVLSVATPVDTTLNPDIFFLLFLPPLLFIDGWRIPRDEMTKDTSTILELALGLVFLTVIGVGFFIHWLIPSIPLAAAFALAAIVSPTDPIAVSAIAQRVPVPKRMMHILEGESLLNDASGLVCFRFAVAAVLTGTFSLYDAALEFVWLAVGGIGIGIAVTWGITRAKDIIISRYGEDSGTQILVSLLIPFASYLAAEHAGCSGILAAVAAGLTMGFVESTGRAMAATRIHRNTVWDTIQYTANGVIFILLGAQFPNIVASSVDIVRATGHHEPWWLIVYVLAINAALAALRFIWVWVSLKLTMYRKKSHGLANGDSPSLRVIFVMSLSGVRGAITLAGVLTLPLTLLDGTPFPARDLMIFLSMGVIIVSLFVASYILPWMLKGLVMPQEHDLGEEEERARISAAEAAIAEIEQVQHRLSEGKPDVDSYVQVAARLMEAYRHRILLYENDATAPANTRELRAAEKTLWLAAIRAERTTILRMLRNRKIHSVTARKLVRELDLQETRLD